MPHLLDQIFRRDRVIFILFSVASLVSSIMSGSEQTHKYYLSEGMFYFLFLYNLAIIAKLRILLLMYKGFS